MARDARKLQKRKEKRNKREKEKRQEHRREISTSPIALLAEAGTNLGEFLYCDVSAEMFSQGIGNLFVARELPDCRVVYVSFLIDTYCLGVKNTLCNVAARSVLPSIHAKCRPNGPGIALSPAVAKKLITGAVAYASQLGLRPHKDYARLLGIFSDVDASACTREFTFGKDGKPFYIAGPNDNAAFQRRVLATLSQSAGADNFDFVMSIGEHEIDLTENEEYEEYEEDEYEIINSKSGLPALPS